MIVQARVRVDRSAAVVLGVLEEYLHAGGMDAAASAVVTEHEPVLLRAGVAGATKKIAVCALSPTRYPTRVVIPMRWVATGVSGELFPVLDANLEITTADAGHSVLVLTGSYQPPFGRAGAALDRMVMHRVAAATLAGFLHRLRGAVGSARHADERADPSPETRRETRRETRAGGWPDAFGYGDPQQGLSPA